MLRTSVLKVRQVRRRAVDWLALAGKVSTDGARTDINRLRDLYDEINQSAKMYEVEPAAIDFAQYRKDISAPGVVDEFEVCSFFFSKLFYVYVYIFNIYVNMHTHKIILTTTTINMYNYFKQAAYNSIVYPEIQLSESTIAGMNDKMDQILADAATMREESVTRLAELESMIAEAEANKTTRDTTIDEVLARHPHIAAEIDDEIEKHQWWKDVQ
jgi:hypothetical protein